MICNQCLNEMNAETLVCEVCKAAHRKWYFYLPDGDKDIIRAMALRKKQDMGKIPQTSEER